MSRLASSALTVITVSEWPRMSCRSRAKRLRSSSSASRAFSSRTESTSMLRLIAWVMPQMARVATRVPKRMPGSRCQPGTRTVAAYVESATATETSQAHRVCRHITQATAM